MQLFDVLGEHVAVCNCSILINLRHAHTTQNGTSKWHIKMAHQNGTSKWDIKMGHQHGTSKWDINMGHQITQFPEIMRTHKSTPLSFSKTSNTIFKKSWKAAIHLELQAAITHAMVMCFCNVCIRVRALLRSGLWLFWADRWCNVFFLIMWP